MYSSFCPGCHLHAKPIKNKPISFCSQVLVAGMNKNKNARQGSLQKDTTFLCALAYKAFIGHKICRKSTKHTGLEFTVAFYTTVGFNPEVF